MPRAGRGVRPLDGGAIPPSRVNDDAGAERVKMMMPVATQQRAAIKVRLGEPKPAPKEPNEAVYFIDYAVGGLVPPFSDFFLQVLETYQVQMLHLTPNAVMVLGIFAHLCEMFVGVMPSVDLFRRYFTMRSAPKNKATDLPERVGSVYFHGRPGVEFIPMALKNKWDLWRQHWVYIGVDANDRLLFPTEAAQKVKSWTESPREDARLAPVTARIAGLVAAGLNAYMVAGDFLGRRLAPLNRRPRACWLYTGPRDIARTHPDDLSEEALGLLMAAALEGGGAANRALPDSVTPLCADRERAKIQKGLPRFDAVGIVVSQITPKIVDVLDASEDEVVPAEESVLSKEEGKRPAGPDPGFPAAKKAKTVARAAVVPAATSPSRADPGRTGTAVAATPCVAPMSAARALSPEPRPDTRAPGTGPETVPDEGGSEPPAGTGGEVEPASEAPEAPASVAAPGTSPGKTGSQGGTRRLLRPKPWSFKGPQARRDQGPKRAPPAPAAGGTGGAPMAPPHPATPQPSPSAVVSMEVAAATPERAVAEPADVPAAEGEGDARAQPSPPRGERALVLFAARRTGAAQERTTLVSALEQLATAAGRAQAAARRERRESSRVRADLESGRGAIAMAMQELTARTVATEIFVATRRLEVEAAERRIAQLEAAAKVAADEASRARSEMEAREKDISSREDRVRAQEAGLAAREREISAREAAAVISEEAAKLSSAIAQDGMSRLLGETKRLVSWERDLEEQEADHRREAEQAKLLAADIDAKAEALATREATLDYKENSLAPREAAVKAAEARLAEMEREAEASRKRAADFEAVARGAAVRAASSGSPTPASAASLAEKLARTEKRLTLAQNHLANRKNLDSEAGACLERYGPRVRGCLERIGIRAPPRKPGRPTGVGQELVELGDLLRTLDSLSQQVHEVLEKEGRELATRVAEYILGCYRARDAEFSLAPVLEGFPAEGEEEARKAVADTAATVAGFFDRGEHLEDPGTDESDEDAGPLRTPPGVRSEDDE